MLAVKFHKRAVVLAFSALAACSVGGAEDTHVFVREAGADQAIIGIHISLLNHPEETHVLGYNKMQDLANATCDRTSGRAAEYTGKQFQRSLGNAYDTWIERTYRCV
ncbi:hypothetical protein [Cochlodiniinecator piscidefendens]|uniref:hypothetical protein n=1 Tax=Cochlodiniinecator piscidefendens TaxID=2715756 RepID=UPI00140C4B8F|nr:hypothetical protein [Cochlodiniinecator piscidefendens]